MKSFISKEQVKELLNDMENEISIQELSKWLKFFEESAKKNLGKHFVAAEMLPELKKLKNYL